jgi:hypothetical protein
MTWCWPNGSTTQRPYIPPATGFYGPRAPIDTNGDGVPDTSNIHTGVDFTGLSTVYAVGPGIVVYVGYSGDAGYEVRIQHDGFTSRYYHLVKDSFRVKVGDRVNGGTPVGVEGHSGLAKGDHLHLRFDTPDGRHFDPLPTLTGLIASQGGGAGGGGLPIDEEEESEDDMFAPKLAIRTDGTLEGSLVAPWLVGPSALERGYIISTDEDEIEAWSRLFARGSGTAHAQVTRDGGYTAIQDTARVLHARWLATAVPAAGGAVDVSALVAEIRALGSKVDALPAEIDRYADGRKQG